MGLADKLNQLTEKAKGAAVDHREQIQQTVGKATGIANQRTGGKYQDKLAKAQAKADAFLEEQAQRSSPAAAPGQSAPPQGVHQPGEDPTGTP